MALLGLPPELLNSILLLLPKAEQKQFRSVSRACKGLVTPLLFDEVMFDLEPGGCDSLVSIGAQLELRPHVHTLHLQRRRGVKSLGDFENWHSSTVHEYTPWFDEHSIPFLSSDPRAMSREAWQALGEDKLRQLYSEYKRDERALEDYMSRLAYAMSSTLWADPIQERQIQHGGSDARRILRSFTSVMNLLTSVTAFDYTPAYLDEEHWGRKWRNIEFHPEALIAYGDYGKDPDIDALRLFIAFRAACIAPNLLRFAEIFTIGHSFWNVPHLRRLLDWSPRLFPRSITAQNDVETGLESWVDDIGGSLAAMRYTEALARDLVALERAFSRLAHFSCRIDTIWSDGPDELNAAARFLGNSLKEAKTLESLALVFREHAASDDCGTYAFFDPDLEPQEISQGMLEHPELPGNFILDSIVSFEHLQRLHLSCATDSLHLLTFLRRLPRLRYLRLTFVALLAKGDKWDDVLKCIAQDLRLHDIRLHTLEDICNNQPRLILCPKYPVWSSHNTDHDAYSAYETAIIRFALRQSSVPPQLSPDEFVTQRHQLQASPS